MGMVVVVVVVMVVVDIVGRQALSLRIGNDERLSFMSVLLHRIDILRIFGPVFYRPS